VDSASLSSVEESRVSLNLDSDSWVIDSTHANRLKALKARVDSLRWFRRLGGTAPLGVWLTS